MSSGRDDRGNRKGAWRQNKNRQQGDPAPSGDKSAGKLAEPFMLPGNPSTTKYYDWIDALYNWASQFVSRWGWHRVLDRHNPGPRPEAVEPDLPDPEQFEFEHQARAAERVYLQRMARFDDISREMRQDEVKLFLQMKIYLTAQAKRDLEDRHEQAAYDGENVIVLRDALAETMLGKPVGQLGNALDIAKQRKQFMGIMQRSGQTVQDFYEFFQQSFEALVQAETSGDKTRDEVIEQDWPADRVVEHFLACLNERSVGDYLDELRFDADADMPPTIEEAFKSACLAAKKQSEKMKRQHQSHDRIGTYATHTRDGYNSRGRGEGRDNRGGKGQGDRGNRSPSRERSNARDIVFDAEGNKCCFAFRQGRCRFGNDCIYSHKASVSGKSQSVSSGKGPGVDQDVVNAIAKLKGTSKGTVAIHEDK
jgi:hypothetical protein